MLKLTSNKKQTRATIQFEQRDLTLQEVGDCFDITKERIRQIEARALRKMRAALALKGITSNHLI